VDHPATGTAPDRHHRAPPDSRRWYALAVIGTAFLMGVLDSTSVYAALPSIATELAFSAAGIQWVMTAYGVTVGGLLLLGGRIADLVGRRRVFMTAVALFAAASLCCGLAWSSEVLVAARVAQGVGAAIMTPAGLSILMTVFPEGPDRNKALGVWGGLGGIGATAGLLLGGALTDALGWAWIFYVNVPVCLAVLVASPLLLPESRDRDRARTFDLAGALTVTGALVLLLYALFTVTDVGWNPLQTATMAAGAITLGGLFVVFESRSVAPLVPLRIFRSRTLLGGNLVILVAGIAVDGLLIIVTLYAQQVLGYTALQFGLAMAVMTGTSVAGVMIAQHVVTRIGFRSVAAGGMALLAAACLILAQLSAHGTFVSDLLMGLLVFGAGMGAAFVAAQIAALTGIADHESGLASGIEETSFAVGTTLGVAVASGVAVSHTSSLVSGGTASVLAQTAGFQAALYVAAGFAVLGLVAALTLLGPRQRPKGLSQL
jgi:EmrB/QacA subfamily drug resistance transporter